MMTECRQQATGAVIPGEGAKTVRFMYCSACNLQYSDHLRYCKQCGHPLVRETAESPAPSRCCTRCGARVSSRENFCQQCGARLRVRSEDTTIGACSSCGTAWRSAWLYCRSCGLDRDHALQFNIAPSPPEQAVPTISMEPVSVDKGLETIVEAVLRCGRCGAEALPYAQYCEICGYSLTGSAPPAPAANLAPPAGLYEITAEPANLDSDQTLVGDLAPDSASYQLQDSALAQDSAQAPDSARAQDFARAPDFAEAPDHSLDREPVRAADQPALVRESEAGAGNGDRAAREDSEDKEDEERHPTVEVPIPADLAPASTIIADDDFSVRRKTERIVQVPDEPTFAQEARSDLPPELYQIAAQELPSDLAPDQPRVEPHSVEDLLAAQTVLERDGEAFREQVAIPEESGFKGGGDTSPIARAASTGAVRATVDSTPIPTGPIEEDLSTGEIAGTDTQAPSTEVWQTSAARSRRAAWQTIAIGASLFVLAVLVALIIWQRLQPRASSSVTPAPASSATAGAARPDASPAASSAPGTAATGEAAPEAMVYVPGATFKLGRDDGDEFAKPAHEVTVGAFYIDRTEVTNEQYQRFVRETGHRAPPHWEGGEYRAGEASLPVVNVSWEDARAYAAWAGKRLPTEAEWELAARGTDGRLYPWGQEWDGARANTREAGRGRIVAVGSFPEGASPYGALDMIGNVWEWTASDPVSYRGDGRLLAPGKVIRGGAYDVPRERATATYRGVVQPGRTYDKTGFRCVKPAR